MRSLGAHRPSNRVTLFYYYGWHWSYRHQWCCYVSLRYDEQTEAATWISQAVQRPYAISLAIILPDRIVICETEY